MHPEHSDSTAARRAQSLAGGIVTPVASAHRWHQYDDFGLESVYEPIVRGLGWFGGMAAARLYAVECGGRVPGKRKCSRGDADCRGGLCQNHRNLARRVQRCRSFDSPAFGVVRFVRRGSASPWRVIAQVTLVAKA